MSSYAERATRGAAILDEHLSDWAERIDCYALDMVSEEDCIIGQIFGDWFEGTEELGIYLDRQKQEECGFELTVNEYLHQDHEVYLGDLLKSAWLKEINKRLSV